MDIQLDPQVRPLVQLGVLGLEGCRVTDTHPLLDRWLAERAGTLRREWEGRTAGEIPEMGPARRLYRAAGLDPTRNRPSSEALVRRVLRGGELPRINSAVDLCNLAATTYFLSIGLYDRDKLRPPLAARLGDAGEWYEGLGKPRVNLEGRFLLEDGGGPFGNPSSDSRRTAVDGGSRHLLWVVYAPVDYPPERLAEHLTWSGDRALEAGLCEGATPGRIVSGQGGA